LTLNQRANLVVSYERPYKVESQVEVDALLSLIHAKGSYSAPFNDGVFKLEMEEDPRKIIRRLDYLLNLDPDKIKFTQSWAPVDVWCRSDLGSISDAVSDLGGRIDDEESWKIVLRREDCPALNMGKLIDTLSHSILKPRSSLLNPQRILLVHILGWETAISLLRPEELLEVGKVGETTVDEGIKITLG
jgi:tRNA(Ser,Leu) C12 N-acetylase TAN1